MNENRVLENGLLKVIGKDKELTIAQHLSNEFNLKENISLHK